MQGCWFTFDRTKLGIGVLFWVLQICFGINMCFHRCDCLPDWLASWLGDTAYSQLAVKAYWAALCSCFPDLTAGCGAARQWVPASPGPGQPGPECGPGKLVSANSPPADAAPSNDQPSSCQLRPATCPITLTHTCVFRALCRLLSGCAPSGCWLTAPSRPTPWWSTSCPTLPCTPCRAPPWSGSATTGAHTAAALLASSVLRLATPLAPVLHPG